MAIPFLNNINLNDNEIQNVKLHLTGSSPGDNQGQIYLHNTQNKVKVYTTAWKNVAFEDWVTSNFNNYVLPLADNGTRGGIQIGYTENGKNYPVELSSEKAFVNVPWTDTTTNETITLSGDLSGSGTSTINATIIANAVEAGMLNNNVISGQAAALTSGLVGTDEFLISDAGTIKKMDVSVLQSYMQSNLTFTNDTNTTYDFNLAAVSGNATVLTLDASTGDDDTVTFEGTTNEIEITTPTTGDAGTVKIGLPNNVTITNDLTVGGDINVTGSLNSYTTSELLVQDQYITLNSGQTSGVLDAFVKVERGATDVAIKWNEGTDRWQFTNDGSTYYNIPISSEYDNFNFNVQVGGTSQEVADGGTILFAQNGGLTVTIGGDDTITYSHADTSSQSSVNNSGRTYIQDITLDTYGHITGITSATETVTNTDTQLATAASLIDVSVMNTNSTATITHNLASKNLIVQMYDTTSGLVLFADIDHVSNNVITLAFALTGAEMVAKGIGDIRVVIIDAKNGLTDITPTYGA